MNNWNTPDVCWSRTPTTANKVHQHLYSPCPLLANLVCFAVCRLYERYYWTRPLYYRNVTCVMCSKTPATHLFIRLCRWTTKKHKSISPLVTLKGNTAGSSKRPLLHKALQNHDFIMSCMHSSDLFQCLQCRLFHRCNVRKSTVAHYSKDYKKQNTK